MHQSERTSKADAKEADAKEADAKEADAKETVNYFLVRLVLLLACLLLGFLAMSQYKSLQKTPEEKFIDGKTTSELSNDYITLYDKYTALLERNEQLTQNVSDLEAAKNGDTELQTILKGEAEEAGREAGILPVTGSGIIVVINPDKEVPITSNMLIQFVNEIKAADARAISVNDQRVVSMTEMRDTVSGFSVNGVQFSFDNPITIMAAGNGVGMYSALQMVGGVLDKWEQGHIDVHVDIKDNLTVPALGEEQQAKMDLSAFSVPQVTASPTPVKVQ